ncbi:MAG: 3-methyl-2-oxobutanoate hydroxymethyltransferase, partial [Verrucomicrobiota bacterium]
GIPHEDSYGMTHLGFENTLPVTVEMMLQAAAAVARAKPQPLVIADVPFAIAQRSLDKVLATCARFLQEAGVDGVKLEGGVDIAEKVSALTASGIPVLGHIGLLPQQVLQLGGYRKFGKTQAEQDALVRDARALQQAGAFALIGEMMTGEAVRAVVDSTDIPLIGIGSGDSCDGQILVSTDLLGFNPKPASFVKTYANLKETVTDAFRAYAVEVREGKFPV